VLKNRPEAPVIIDGDARVPWKDVIDIVNICKALQIDNIEFALGGRGKVEAFRPPAARPGPFGGFPGPFGREIATRRVARTRLRDNPARTMTTPSEPRPPSEEPRRRPFDGQTSPEPFHRLPEFVRFIWLAGALALVVPVFYVVSSGGKKVASAQAPPPRRRARTHRPRTSDPMARSVRLSTLFEGALVDSHNGEGFAETEGYRKLLQTLSTYPSDQVEKLATQKLDWTAATKDPDAWRGQFVWTRGVHRPPLGGAPPQPGIRRAGRLPVILTDGDGSEAFVIDIARGAAPRSPPERPVDVQGIFYRTIGTPRSARRRTA
jgi:hypothetical protein